RSARVAADGEYVESADLSGYFEGRMLEGDDVVSLMDYQSAGFTTPPRLAAALRVGDYPWIVVEKGLRPYDVWNHNSASWIPTPPEYRFLYSPEVREAFDRCYRKGDLGLSAFDAYRHIDGCR